MSFANFGRSSGGLWCSVSRSDTLGRSALAAALTEFEFVAPPGQSAEPGAIVPSWAKRELLEWTESTAPALPMSAARGLIATGWPAPAMWMSFDQQPGAGYWWFKARNGIVLAAAPATSDFSALSPRERTVPTRIVLWGFLICVAFWSAVWIIPLRLLRATRTHFRKRAGRCIRCGYDLKGLALGSTCPECGTDCFGKGQE